MYEEASSSSAAAAATAAVEEAEAALSAASATAVTAASSYSLTSASLVTDCDALMPLHANVSFSFSDESYSSGSDSNTQLRVAAEYTPRREGTTLAPLWSPAVSFDSSTCGADGCSGSLTLLRLRSLSEYSVTLRLKVSPRVGLSVAWRASFVALA